MKLLGSMTSPFVRKVRVVMVEKKLEFEFVLEDVWAADTKIQEFNPLGKVPCLVTDDGGSLYDSRVIVEYLDTLSPVGRLLPQGNRDRTATKCWEAIGDGVLDAGVSIVVEGRRPEHLRSEDWVNRQHKKIISALNAMERGVSQNHFCMGVNFSLADVSVGCALGFLDFRMPDLNWRENHPNLAALYERLMARPSFATTVPKLTA
ncbi:MAG: glutathione S-transferase [Alcaligenaceae bacterium]|jgi:glutathione S-transferase|nr:glutathione S-transferase [Alcaligenaceae bacterium]